MTPPARIHLLTLDDGDLFRFWEGGPVYRRTTNPEGLARFELVAPGLDAPASMADLASFFVIPEPRPRTEARP